MERLNIQQLSPNMLKTFELCPKKFYFKYIKNIQMPLNDDIYELGKNIHALASYYLKKENIDKMEKSLSEKEMAIWKYLKSSEYFSYEVIGTEYNLAFRFKNHFFGGRLDALVKNDNEYYILDYKTGSIPKNSKYDFQTLIYMLAVHKFYKTDNIKFIYIDLKNKDEVIISYSKELGDEYIKKLNLIVDKIEHSESYNKKKDCKCEYEKICY